MRVDIEDEALLSGEPLTLLGLFAFGYAGRHRVFASQAALDRWPPLQCTPLRDEVELALELAYQSETLAPSVRAIVVGGSSGSPSWGPVPRLPPEVALRMLARPLRVLLENGQHDRDFVLAFAPPATRRTLEDAERRGWLSFNTGGGVSGLTAQLEALSGQCEDAARVLILSDSD